MSEPAAAPPSQVPVSTRPPVTTRPVSIPSVATRRFAGFLLVTLPTVVYGGTALLRELVGNPAYQANALRQDLWRAGHAHAGVLLILSLVALSWVDGARLSPRLRALVRVSIPSSAIFLPAAFFLSVLSPTATEPNGFLHLAWVGAGVLVVGLLVLAVGLLRAEESP